jgi:hypothetical protein
MRLLALLCLATCEFSQTALPSQPDHPYFYFQSFGDRYWHEDWVTTTLTNYTGEWKVELISTSDDEKMLFTKSRSSHYGISAQFPRRLHLTNKSLVLQYELRAEEGLDYGGAYIKLFAGDSFFPETLSKSTPYVVMFGPDRSAGSNKIHFIFHYQDRTTGTTRESHMRENPPMIADKLTHLYSLIVRPDNSFEILIDCQLVRWGSLASDFDPPVIATELFDEDVPEMIPDPEIERPADWDDLAGPWVPVLVKNPAFELRKSFFEPIAGIGFELWMVDSQVGFNNVYVGTDEAAMRKWNEAHFLPKFRMQGKKEADRGERDRKGDNSLDTLDRYVEMGEDAKLSPGGLKLVIVAVLGIAVVGLVGGVWICARRENGGEKSQEGRNEDYSDYSDYSDDYYYEYERRRERGRRRRRRRRDYSDDEYEGRRRRNRGARRRVQTKKGEGTKKRAPRKAASGRVRAPSDSK